MAAGARPWSLATGPEREVVVPWRHAQRAAYILLLGAYLTVGCGRAPATSVNGPRADENPRRVTASQTDELRERLARLVRRGYSLEVRQNEHDPYRWRSSGEFTGVTFYFKGDELFDKRRGKKRPCIELTFLPAAYDGEPIPFGEDRVETQVMLSVAELLGKWRDLKVFGCRDFGYALPEKGPLSERNIRRTLGLIQE